jgi:CelD/BcsL family acetyltransferase involved in cellulose biosynthesis
MFEVSSKSWKAREGNSILDDPRAEAFYRNITEQMGKKAMVELWLVRHDGKAIAFEYHLRHQNTAYPIRADYDEEYRHLSPGSVLEYQVIKSLFENPEVYGYNSCGHTYDYLMKWATQTREYVDFQIFNSKAYSRNLFRLESRMIPAVRKARDFLKPKAEGASA